MLRVKLMCTQELVLALQINVHRMSSLVSSSQAFGNPRFPQVFVLVLGLMCTHMLPRDPHRTQQTEPLTPGIVDCISIDINTLQAFSSDLQRLRLSPIVNRNSRRPFCFYQGSQLEAADAGTVQEHSSRDIRRLIRRTASHSLIPGIIEASKCNVKACGPGASSPRENNHDGRRRAERHDHQFHDHKLSNNFSLQHCKTTHSQLDSHGSLSGHARRRV